MTTPSRSPAPAKVQAPAPGGSGQPPCPSYTDGVHRFEKGRTWTAPRRCCCRKAEPKRQNRMTLGEAMHGEGYCYE